MCNDAVSVASRVFVGDADATRVENASARWNDAPAPVGMLSTPLERVTTVRESSERSGTWSFTFRLCWEVQSKFPPSAKQLWRGQPARRPRRGDLAAPAAAELNYVVKQIKKYLGE